MALNEKVTADKIFRMKPEGKKITALAVYDYAFAALADRAGVDIALVGDSLGMTFQGEENTLKVTMDHIAYHTRAVAKGLSRALLVADMPFMSFRVSEEKTLENAARLISEGAEAVKLEGAEGVTEVIRKLTLAGVPVMGHLGLTPQSIHSLGGFKVQGQGAGEAQRLIDDAMRLQDAGVFSMVLECVPMELGAQIAAKTEAPVIGIGAGPYCDGQILVASDILGLTLGHTPKFVKKYAALGNAAQEAFAQYVAETRNGAFPTEAQSYSNAPRKLKAL